jgi:hypothetical protein
MVCPSCGRGKARRQCPALDRQICTVCCGTKRLVEIQCPSDCGYLASSREHPAAIVRRQQEHDVARLLPTIRHLTERQYQLFFLFHSAIAEHRPDGFARLVDADVVEAAAAFAATLETAARGVIYDHVPASVPAQSLTRSFKALLAKVREQGGTVYDGEAAIALRAIAEGGGSMGTSGDGGRVYLDLMGRLLQSSGRSEPAQAAAPAAGSLILP